MMKKFLALSLVIVLTFSLLLISCGKAVMSEAELEALEEINQDVRDEFAKLRGETVIETDKESESEEESKDDFVEEDSDTGVLRYETLNGMTPWQLYYQERSRINVASNFTVVADEEMFVHLLQNGETFDYDDKQTTVKKYVGNDFSMVSQNADSVNQLNCQYVGGMVYNVRSEDGHAIRYYATPDQLSQVLGMNPFAAKFVNIPDSWFSGIVFLKYQNDNRYCLEFELQSEQHNLIFENTDIFKSFDTSEISNVKYTVYFTEEGRLESAVSSAVLKTQNNGMETTVDYINRSSVKDFDVTVVAAPSNPQMYTPVDVSNILANKELDIHNYEGNWVSDDTSHWHNCNGEKCSSVGDKAVHTWNGGEIVTPATETADGLKLFTCTVCAKTKTEAVKYGPAMTVTEAEWRAALARELYYNVTVVYGDNGYDESTGQAFLRFKETIEYDGDLRRLDGEVRENSGDMDSAEIADIVGMGLEYYSSAVYDENLGVYVLSPQSEGEVRFPLVYKFENGKLICFELHYASTVEEMYKIQWMTLEFSNYGTTVLAQ